MLCCIQDSKALSTIKSQHNSIDKSVNILSLCLAPRLGVPFVTGTELYWAVFTLLRASESFTNYRKLRQFRKCTFVQLNLHCFFCH